MLHTVFIYFKKANINLKVHPPTFYTFSATPNPTNQ